MAFGPGLTLYAACCTRSDRSSRRERVATRCRDHQTVVEQAVERPLALRRGRARWRPGQRRRPRARRRAAARGGGRAPGDRCPRNPEPAGSVRRLPRRSAPRRSATGSSRPAGRPRSAGLRLTQTSAPSSISATEVMTAAADHPAAARVTWRQPSTAPRAAQRPSGHDPAHVRVDDRDPAAVGERRDGRGRVTADPRQRAQLLDRSRHLAAVSLDAEHRSRMQPQRPARVAEAAPLAYRLTCRRRGQRLRGGPTLEPAANTPAAPARPGSAAT